MYLTLALCDPFIATFCFPRGQTTRSQGGVLAAFNPPAYLGS